MSSHPKTFSRHCSGLRQTGTRGRSAVEPGTSPLPLCLFLSCCSSLSPSECSSGSSAASQTKSSSRIQPRPNCRIENVVSRCFRTSAADCRLMVQIRSVAEPEEPDAEHGDSFRLRCSGLTSFFCKGQQRSSELSIKTGSSGRVPVQDWCENVVLISTSPPCV